MTTGKDKKSVPSAKLLEELIKLDRNENPLGPSPLAIEAAREALLNCHRYPCRKGLVLKNRLASHLAILPQTITLGNGSEDLIALIAKTYLTTEDSVVIPQFTFMGIVEIIKKTGAKLRIVNNTYNCVKAAQILETIHSSTKIIFIVNPNNPTGTYINTAELTFLLTNLPTNILLVIDEAYAEYVRVHDYPNTLKLTEKYLNLIISRTFSKFYALAGLRLGYLISHPKITQVLTQQCLPFAVNSIALAAANAALSDYEHIEATYLINQRGHSQLIEGLRSLSLHVNPSHTNFVCVDLRQDSETIYKQLLSYGIYVRPLHDYGLFSHLRIAIGSEKENQQFLEILRQIL